MTNKIKNNLKYIVHKTFIKYDIIWVIGKWFPEDEYQMEESKLILFIENNMNCVENDIYQELIKIIIDWFWNDLVWEDLLKILKKMSEEIYSNLKED